jgi:hypothetical protein
VDNPAAWRIRRQVLVQLAMGQSSRAVQPPDTVQCAVTRTAAAVVGAMLNPAAEPGTKSRSEGLKLAWRVTGAVIGRD